MKARVYIDTSVIGGCYDEEFEKWSLLLFEEFRNGKKIAVISDITLQELELARVEIRQLVDTIPADFKEYIISDEEVAELAKKYLDRGAITKRYYEDALHIAIATINRVDVLVSWNFKHIVNLNRIRLYNSVNLISGYPLIEIRNPREILNEELK
jgi:predicted nucleic acid-binding protein